MQQIYLISELEETVPSIFNQLFYYKQLTALTLQQPNIVYLLLVYKPLAMQLSQIIIGMPGAMQVEIYVAHHLKYGIFINHNETSMWARSPWEKTLAPLQYAV